MPRIVSSASLLFKTSRSYADVLNDPRAHLPIGIEKRVSCRRVEVRFNEQNGNKRRRHSQEEPSFVVYEVGDKLMIAHAGVNTVAPSNHTRAMSYWYATLERIFVDKRRPLYRRIWFQVRWLYRASDIKDLLPAEADAMLPYELVETDHTTIVNFRTVQDRIAVNVIDDHASYAPWLASPNEDAILQRWSIKVEIVLDEDGFQNPAGMRMHHYSRCAVDGCEHPHYDYHSQQRFCDKCNRWSHVRCLFDAGKESSEGYALTTLPPLPDSPKFVHCLLTPIARGGPLPLFGNGMNVEHIRTIFDGYLKNKVLPHDWENIVNIDALWPVDIPRTYFICVCNKGWI